MFSDEGYEPLDVQTKYCYSILLFNIVIQPGKKIIQKYFTKRKDKQIKLIERRKWNVASFSNRHFLQTRQP